MNDDSVALLGLVICLALYFLPSIIAMARHHRNVLAIFLCNLLTGWTMVGWVVAIVWSVAR